MNSTHLSDASHTLLAVASCVTAAGGSPADILETARYFRHAAQRLAAEETLSVIAHEWHAPAPVPAVDLPDTLVPWPLVNAAALDGASETLRELVRVKAWIPGPFLAAALAEVDALRDHFAAAGDAKSAVGLHVLAGRLARSLPAA